MFNNVSKHYRHHPFKFNFAPRSPSRGNVRDLVNQSHDKKLGRLRMQAITQTADDGMCVITQGWPTQLHHWANISAPILKRAAKLLLMTNSHYFTSFSSNFLMIFFENLIFYPLCYTCQKPIPPKCLRHLNKINIPRKMFPP